MSAFYQLVRPRFNGNGSHGCHGGHGGRPAGGYAPPQPVLPAYLTRLNWLCKSASHALPVRMQFVGVGYSDKGQAFAEYRCPLCGMTQGIVPHFQTGKPFVLFTRNG